MRRLGGHDRRKVRAGLDELVGRPLVHETISYSSACGAHSSHRRWSSPSGRGHVRSRRTFSSRDPVAVRRGEGSIRSRADLVGPSMTLMSDVERSEVARTPFEFVQQCRPVAATALRGIDEQVAADPVQVVVAGHLEGSDRHRSRRVLGP